MKKFYIIKLMKYLALLLFLPLFTAKTYALKLELTAGIDSSYKSYKNVINTNGQENLDFYSNNSHINFAIKKIILEKTDNSHMDVFIGLKSINVDKSSKTLNSLNLIENISFYEEINRPFINQAYSKIYNFYDEGINLWLGRQSYILGQGLTLSDNSNGFDGIKIETANKFYLDKTEFFIFRNIHNEKTYRLAGFNLLKQGFDGIWQAYFLSQNRSQEAQDIGFDSKNQNKYFIGGRYFLQKNQILFDGEYILQRGQAENAANSAKIDYNGYAFLIKGEWKQKTPLLGYTKTRFSYAKSSGQKSAISDEAGAFVAEFADRFDGASRKGRGEILSASSYDIFKTSNTLNGLPDGLSGLNSINLGFDMPYQKLLLSADLFIYRAAQNINDPGNLKLGSEWDIKAEYKMGEKLILNLIYSTFKPQSALNKSFKNIQMTSIGVKARF